MLRPLAIATATAVCATAAFVCVPRRCKAESPTLRRIRDNYEKNKLFVANQNRDEVMKWGPLKKYAHIISQLDDRDVFELSYMKHMYQPPLNEFGKSRVFNTIIEFMKRAKTPEEEQMFTELAKWYGIVD